MREKKILIGVVVYNEETKLPTVLQNFKKTLNKAKYFVLFIDDHSIDQSKTILEKFVQQNKNTKIISNKKNCGVGKAIKTIIDYGIQHRYNICVIMAGNGKDNPLEIKNIVSPILTDNYDYVQGSRFLKGGSFDNLPFVRKNMVKGFTFLVYLFTGFQGTDASNGFRAYKLNLFKDRRIRFKQNWLDRYEFETYLHYKVITLRYKICEVAVSKKYLYKVKDYSKIKPIIDWWKMIRPLIYLKFRVKQ